MDSSSKKVSEKHSNSQNQSVSSQPSSSDSILSYSGGQQSSSNYGTTVSDNNGWGSLQRGYDFLSKSKTDKLNETIDGFTKINNYVIFKSKKFMIDQGTKILLRKI